MERASSSNEPLKVRAGKGWEPQSLKGRQGDRLQSALENDFFFLSSLEVGASVFERKKGKEINFFFFLSSLEIYFDRRLLSLLLLLLLLLRNFVSLLRRLFRCWLENDFDQVSSSFVVASFFIDLLSYSSFFFVGFIFLGQLSFCQR